MIHSPACTALVMRSEGCSLKAYADPVGVLTIGWGHTGADVHKGLVWSQTQADRVLQFDLSQRDAATTAMLDGHPTTQGQFDALVDFAFNLGADALKGSTLLKLHRAGKYSEATLEFARWNKASGKVLDGLTKRRAAEAALYRGVHA